MRENLDDSLELLFGSEGGYSDKTSDRGNFLAGKLVGTKYGITGKTLAMSRGVGFVTASDVKTMTIKEAEEIYRKGYWGQVGGDELPAGLDYACFDSGVMSGPQAAIKQLQRILRRAGVYDGEIDGWPGPGTLGGVKRYPGGLRSLITDYCAERMRFMQSLTNAKTGFPANGRGWTIRVTGKDPLGKWKAQPGVIGNALKMADRQPVTVMSAVPPAVVADQASAKADVVTTIAQAVGKPEVLLPAAGAAVTGAAPLVMGSNAIQYALAFGVVVLFVIGAVYAVRRILKSA